MPTQSGMTSGAMHDDPPPKYLLRLEGAGGGNFKQC